MSKLVAALIALTCLARSADAGVFMIQQQLELTPGQITSSSFDVDAAFYGFDSSFGTLQSVYMDVKVGGVSWKAFYCGAGDPAATQCATTNLGVRVETLLFGDYQSSQWNGSDICGIGQCGGRIQFFAGGVFNSGDQASMAPFIDPIGGFVFFDDVIRISQFGSPLCLTGPCNIQTGQNFPSLYASMANVTLRYFFENDLYSEEWGNKEIYHVGFGEGPYFPSGYFRPRVDVPEPVTALTIVFGIAGLGLARRRPAPVCVPATG